MVPLSPQWHEAFQWAVRECERLGIEFDVSLDFGYGSGGPHITPELSMQKLVWSETEIGRRASGHRGAGQGAGRKESVGVVAARGEDQRRGAGSKWNESDSFRDVAVVAIPLPASQEARAYRIAEINAKAGLDWNRPATEWPGCEPPPGAVTPIERVIDLTAPHGPRRPSDVGCTRRANGWSSATAMRPISK